jgi:hypothetical protein
MSSYNTLKSLFRDDFGLADLQHAFLEALHGHIVLQLLNFNDVKYNTHNKEFDSDTLLATLYFSASESSLSRAHICVAFGNCYDRMKDE